MNTHSSLHELEIEEYPVIARRLLLEEVKLAALISAVGEKLYFIPSKDAKTRELAKSFLNDLLEEPFAASWDYLAEKGRYEISDSELAADCLDECYCFSISPELTPLSYGPARFEVCSTISPNGDRGYLFEVELIAGLSEPIDPNIAPWEDGFPGYATKSELYIGPALIPYSRILLEEGSTPKPRYQIDTPEFAAVIEIWEKYWADGKPGMSKVGIVAELTENGRFSHKRAEAIEMICRPINERDGGRKKSK